MTLIEKNSLMVKWSVYWSPGKFTTKSLLTVYHLSANILPMQMKQQSTKQIRKLISSTSKSVLNTTIYFLVD